MVIIRIYTLNTWPDFELNREKKVNDISSYAPAEDLFQIIIFFATQLVFFTFVFYNSLLSHETRGEEVLGLSYIKSGFQSIVINQDHWPITTDARRAMNQSELHTITCNRQQPRENACEQVKIDFWLVEKWPEFCKLIKVVSQNRVKQSIITIYEAMES